MLPAGPRLFASLEGDSSARATVRGGRHRAVAKSPPPNEDESGCRPVTECEWPKAIPFGHVEFIILQLAEAARYGLPRNCSYNGTIPGENGPSLVPDYLVVVQEAEESGKSPGGKLGHTLGHPAWVRLG